MLDIVYTIQAAIDSKSYVRFYRRMGRKKEFPVRITLPLSEEMLAGIDAARDEGEDRLTVIRAAIASELKHRHRRSIKASGRAGSKKPA